MKESYYINPKVLSNREIEEFCKEYKSRLYGLSEMSMALAQKAKSLREECNIHEENYKRVNSFYEEAYFPNMTENTNEK